MVLRLLLSMVAEQGIASFFPNSQSCVLFFSTRTPIHKKCTHRIGHFIFCPAPLGIYGRKTRHCPTLSEFVHTPTPHTHTHNPAQKALHTQNSQSKQFHICPAPLGIYGRETRHCPTLSEFASLRPDPLGSFSRDVSRCGTSRPTSRPPRAPSRRGTETCRHACGMPFFVFFWPEVDLDTVYLISHKVKLDCH